MDIEKEARFNRAQKKKETPTTSRHNTKNTKNTTAARMLPKGTTGIRCRKKKKKANRITDERPE